ncbi:MAG TPA: hypothetical protein VD769_05860 [Gaiellaceae bacterium]|nr:hypothetical protein [Gaiellaceae bacterium]
MRKLRRRKLVAVLAAGMILGVVMVATPAGASLNWNNIWNNHLKPKADARYVKKSAIKTIQGNYAAGLQAGNTADDGWDSISFGFELASAPQEHFLAAGSASTAQCPGSATNPQAAPGHLCVYESVSQNRGSVVIFTGTTGAVNQASKWGAGVWLIPAAVGNAFSYGTWAVTAPAGTTPSRVAPATTGATAGE